MKDGRISEQGTYHELLAQEGEFAEFLVNYLAEEGGKSELDPQTETELEDLKSELEKAMGKEKLERHISVAKSARVSLKRRHSKTTLTFFCPILTTYLPPVDIAYY